MWRICMFRIPGQPRMSACFRAKARLMWVNFWRITSKYNIFFHFSDSTTRFSHSFVVRYRNPFSLPVKSYHFHDFYSFPVLTQPQFSYVC